ncbi:prepilin-type N-terminal cleavage/methylation domain-containing protein [Clostridium cadaveris]|uniref:Prepilin-type N-terminal cleavage/methylation domain-containing protein n=2 Tax=Clostridiaceae TaxID=31979 RepID=A0A1I2LAN0_9CLOT|nr:MAG: prepilin-type N-terminal cleavage/methylation domain-containing protein [Clostridium cadaveris]SFF75598.1 prepilin-type N-terminal cleavage/methylation domain-containing protein [Clostridium cadaveris]
MMRKKKKAMTLIEVIISIGIFAIIAIPISTMILKAIDANRQGEYKQQSINYGQKIMEKLKSLDDEEFLNLDKNHDLQDIEVLKKDMGYALDGSKNGYKITGTITPVEKYTVQKVENAYDSIDADVYLSISSNKNSAMKIKDGIKYDLGMIDDKLSIAINEDSLIINNKKFRNSITSILILFEEDSKNQYILDLNNKKSGLNLYIAKERGSEASYNMNSHGNSINIYEGIIKERDLSYGESRLYNIELKIEKNGKVFNIEGDKRVRR